MLRVSRQTVPRPCSVPTCATLVCLAACLGAALLGPSPASAALEIGTSFGGAGGAAGRTQSPQDVATDASGNVYIADGFNRRISKFTAEGAFVRAWGKDVVPGGGTGFEVCTTTCKAGVAGGSGGELDFPTGISADASGSVFVADKSNNRIQQFTSNGGFVKAWGRDVVATGGTGFEVCTVAADCKAGQTGGNAGELDDPFATGVDGAGNVYVADDGNHRVQRYSAATGAFVRMWGKDVSALGGSGFEVCAAAGAAFCQTGAVGVAAGEFNILRGIDARGSDVYVSDSESNRIQQFTSAGAFVRTWGKDVAVGGGTGFEQCTSSCKAGAAGGGAGELDFPQRVATDAASVYAVDGNNERVAQFTRAGGIVRAWGKDVVAGGGSGFEVCTTSCKAGVPGSGAGEFSSATGVASSTSGVYVADQGNNRVQLFRDGPDPAEPVDPSNEFEFGKAKRNKKKGTAKLTVSVPGAGDVELAQSKKVKGAQKRAEAAGEVQVPIKPKGKAKRKLAKRGKAKVAAEVTFTPDGGAANTESTNVTLKRKR